MSREGAGKTEPGVGFATEELVGRVAPAFRPPGSPDQVAETIRRALDPASALRTLHWGRNYIYLTRLPTAEGSLEVAVKQFPGAGWRKRLRRKLRGSKAQQSWQVARALDAAGLQTPEPVLVAESTDPEGATWFVTRHLEDVFEARYFLRALNAGREREEYPEIDGGRFVDALGRRIRELHAAGFWHRDLSSGNVLVRWHPDLPPDLYLVDLNRTRRVGSLSLSQRSRDLSRMMIHRPEHQERFLRAYWGDDDPRLRWGRRLYHLYHWSFRTKHRVKNRVKGWLRTLKGWLTSRGAHPHIPSAPKDAQTRDRVVWDALSDQPHLHASRFDKLKVRLADAGAHWGQTRAFLRSVPRVRRRHKELRRGLYREPVPFRGAGVAVRPWPQGAAERTAAGTEPHPELLAAVEDLGARSILLRLHPWQQDHRAEEALARELASRGYELTFTLPQNRELVRDLVQGGSRWRQAVAELGERFSPYGSTFQVGQAVNRSKWGVWNAREWVALTAVAADELRRHPGVRLLGPAVIDFEVHQTMGLLSLAGSVASGLPAPGAAGSPDGDRSEPAPFLDALASLLYVDRRGAPENRQLGFDTVDKVVLLKAIAETSRHCGPESWITEVNWPLWEGPHSPAGKSVSVDEETQADYLVRFYVLTLTTGLVERVFWWQMVARGYGLVEPPRDASETGTGTSTGSGSGSGPGSDSSTFRRRPSYRAFRHLLRRLEGATSLGPVPPSEISLVSETSGATGATAEGVSDAVSEAIHLFRFRLPGSGKSDEAREADPAIPVRELIVGWTSDRTDRADRTTDGIEVELPAPVVRAWDRDGGELATELAGGRSGEGSSRVVLSGSPRYFLLASS